jgi:hypothetical protein
MAVTSRRQVDVIIDNRLEVIERQLNQILQFEAARVEREKTAGNDLQHLKEAVDGNGKPGLKADTQLLKEQMGRMNWAAAIFTGAIILELAARFIK